ncbi:FHA domain-containing protein [Arthrobacter sp. Y-9]|uniref:FHA domain-containing protein n=1 Tax=Arthrobacter sp. Y-9 TaxID=3039385 RepID=UPI00241F94D3|nr:FHA domain-containing protein [Arthrobacter sp. Y-9]WFR84959.1 FHA domain-containing protein [Arthrobacter sp. Y-9]
MNTNHYRQGPWLYVLRNGIAVVVSPDSGTERIQQLWELLGRNPSVDQLLNEVTRSFGTSVTGLPDFAVVDHRDSLRVFLRGDLQVRTLDGSGHEVHGRGVTTWNERTLPSSDTFEIRAGEPSDEDDDPWMPLDAGVVTASVLVVGELPVAEEPGEASGDVAAEDLPATAHEDTVDAPLFAAPAPSWNPSASVSPAPQSAVSWDPSSDEDDDEPSYSLDGQTDSLATELLGARAAREDSDAGDSVDAEADQDASEDEAGDEPGQGDGAPLDDAQADGASLDGAVVVSDEEAQATGDGDAGEGPEAASGQHSGDVPAHHHDADAPNDLTTTYDHLWDQFLSTPDGAESSDGAEASDGVKKPDATADANGTGTGSSNAAPDGHGADQDPAPAETPEPSSGPAGQDESQNTLLPSAEAEESLIDEVPWARSGGPAPVVAPVAVPTPAQSPGGVASPPPLPPTPPSFPPGAPQGDDPDHDGHTVFRSELPAGVPQAAPQAAPEAPANGPRVLARMCLRGHANPPTRTHCMICEEQIAGDAASVPRPALGRLRLPSGETVVLDRNVILGRQPSVSRVSGGDMPHLVQVDSPKRDISRSHAEVRLEGWNVVLCDLNSSNGTVLLRDGQSPRRLGQAETALVLSGDVAELGDQVYIVFEDLP